MALRGDRTGLFVILPGISSYAVGVCVVPCLFLSRASRLRLIDRSHYHFDYHTRIAWREDPPPRFGSCTITPPTNKVSITMVCYQLVSLNLRLSYLLFSFHSLFYSLKKEVIKIIKVISFIFESFIHYVYVLLIWFSYIIKTLFGCVVNKFFFVKHSQISHSMPISIRVCITMVWLHTVL